MKIKGHMLLSRPEAPLFFVCLFLYLILQQSVNEEVNFTAAAFERCWISWLQRLEKAGSLNK